VKLLKTEDFLFFKFGNIFFLKLFSFNETETFNCAIKIEQITNLLSYLFPGAMANFQKHLEIYWWEMISFVDSLTRN